jgi:hypothetical protein
MRSPFKYNVTYRPVARQWLGKHIPAGANMRNNRKLDNESVHTPKTIRGQ